MQHEEELKAVTKLLWEEYLELQHVKKSDGEEHDCDWFTDPKTKRCTICEMRRRVEEALGEEVRS